MSQVVIGDILPYTQAIAIASQTVFGTNWTADAASDVVVYQTPSGDDADDVTQILAYPADYSVAFIGSQQQVQVTLVTPASAGDRITITRQTPADRENLYTNTNFVPSMLNNDFGILTLVDQQAQLVDQKIGPRYNYSAIIVDVVDTILPVLEANQMWAKNSGNTAIIAIDVPASGFAPANGTYIVLTPSAELPDALALSAVGSGILVSDVALSTVYARSVTGTANQLTVTNGSGVGGNINVAITDNPIIPGTAGMGIPVGTTAQRIVPTPPNISLRYNTDFAQIEFYDGGWFQLADTSVNINPGLINQLAWYAASGTELSGLPTIANGVLVTDSISAPSISTTLPAGLTIPGYQPTLTFPLTLAQGGTNNTLTASAGGIVWSDATKLNILAGTATPNLPLLSGNLATPSWGAFALNLGGALTTAGALTTLGAFTASFTFTGNTAVTFPTSGTLATTTGSVVTLTGDSGTATASGGNINVVGTGSGLSFSGAASTLTLGGTLDVDNGGTGRAALTAHNLIIGNGTSAVTLLAPSATSGIALISQGAAADPAYGTVVVAGGGTGAVSLTGLITGNGTSAMTGTAITQFNVLTGGASNLPNSVAPSATSGVPLISQGAASQPIFGTAVVAGGGTGVTSVTTSPTATAFAGWDANRNMSADSFLSGYSTTPTAAGTTVLTADSNYWQFFTGATTQTLTLPVASTMVLGQTYFVVNLSSGALTVQSSGGNTVQVMAANTSALITCILTSGTSAASWSVVYYFNGGGSGTVSAGTANQLAYYSATGTTVSGLTGANSSSLVTSLTGVPTWLGPMTNGQMIMGSTGAIPVLGTLSQTAGISIANGAGSITLGNTWNVVTQIFTTPGAYTYTPTAGMVKCIVELQAGGGGSGGVASAAVLTSSTGGGGGGGYLKFLCTAAQIGASISGSVGAAGAGGSAGANNGTAGGNTTFVTASTWTAGGGGLSNGQTAATASSNSTTPGAGGTNTTGTGTLIANIAGQEGGFGSGTYSVTAIITNGGAGGSSQLGRGGAPTFSTSVATAVAGRNATGFGGGGTGAIGLNSNSNVAGGNGSAGCVIITEFILV